MMVSDILQIAVLCALICLPLGYMAHRRLPQSIHYWKNRLLRPRYLKSEGMWVRDNASSQAKK